MTRSTLPFVAAYLLSIILANLTVALAPPAWRGSVVLINSFTLIALDLTAGDRLHEAWKGRGLLWRFAALIVAGSLLSYLLNGAAGPVALVSCAAFGLSALADRAMYGLLDRLWAGWYVRVNGSNLISALIDSGAFLGGLALAGLLPWPAVPWLMAGQWVAKVAGGALWSVMFRRPQAVPLRERHTRLAGRAQAEAIERFDQKRKSYDDHTDRRRGA